VELERDWVEGRRISRRDVWDAHVSFVVVLVEERAMRDTSECRDAIVVDLWENDSQLAVGLQTNFPYRSEPPVDDYNGWDKCASQFRYCSTNF
jgi:hypothetical protein